MADHSCKRCSVTRVNALVTAYRQAHVSGEQGGMNKLKQVVAVTKREYPDGSELLSPGLGEQELRKLCWNISSFMRDQDVERILGIKLNKPGAH